MWSWPWYVWAIIIVVILVVIIAIIAGVAYSRKQPEAQPEQLSP